MKTSDLKSEDAEDITYVEKWKDKKGKFTKKETNDVLNTPAKTFEEEENVEFILMDLKNFDDLNKFQNMKSLTLIQQGIKSIEIIANCLYSSQLEYLCLNENLIQNLSSIEKFNKLKNLQLNNNQIEKLENLENLETLETFWICENKIKNIENLPKNLKSFWIAANQIEKIPENLNEYNEIIELNIAANIITRLTDIFKLKNLKNLKTLLLNDITYGENPLCLLNNYRMFVIHHLTDLESLDLIFITNEEVIEVERTYNKKKMFYTGKIKQNNRISISLLKSLKVFKNFLTVFKSLQIKILSKKLKMLEYLKYEDQMNNNEIEDGKFKELKDLLICKEKIEKCIQIIQTSHLNFNQIKSFVNDINDFQIVK